MKTKLGQMATKSKKGLLMVLPVLALATSARADYSSAITDTVEDLTTNATALFTALMGLAAVIAVGKFVYRALKNAG